MNVSLRYIFAEPQSNPTIHNHPNHLTLIIETYLNYPYDLILKSKYASSIYIIRPNLSPRLRKPLRKPPTCPYFEPPHPLLNTPHRATTKLLPSFEPTATSLPPPPHLGKLENLPYQLFRRLSKKRQIQTFNES